MSNRLEQIEARLETCAATYGDDDLLATDLAALVAVVKAVRDLRNRARRHGPLEALTRDSLIRCLNAALHTLEDES